MDGTAVAMEASARTVFAAFSSLQTEGIGSLLTDDVTLEMPYAPQSTPSRFDGKQAVTGVLSGLAKMFSTFSAESVAASNTLIVEVDSQGEFVLGISA